MKFSIIIPVYNVASYLRECLDSVLVQTHADWEAICVDDGSVDGSGGILDAYAAHDSRFRIVHIKNNGVGNARNVALNLASGEYIIFVDADDVIRRELLSSCKRCIDGHQAIDMVHYDVVRFSGTVNWGETEFTSKLHDIQSCIRCCDFYTLLPQYAYKREVVGNLRFSRHTVGEDLLFMLKCLCRTKIICRVNTPLYAYRQRPGSATNSCWTLRKLSDELAYRMAWISYLHDANRKIEKEAYRLTGLFLTEFFVGYMDTLPDDEQPLIWKKWFETMRYFSMVREFPLWAHFVMTICSLTRSHAVAWVFCCFPHWLKMKGVHR